MTWSWHWREAVRQFGRALADLDADHIVSWDIRARPHPGDRAGAYDWTDGVVEVTARTPTRAKTVIVEPTVIEHSAAPVMARVVAQLADALGGPE